MVNALTFFHKEVYVWAVTYFCEDLETWLTFFDSFVDEDGLSIKHLVWKLVAGGCCGVMTEDNSFISFVNLSFSKDFYKKRRAINQEYSWKSTDTVPYVRRDCLDWGNYHNILLFALKILGS